MLKDLKRVFSYAKPYRKYFVLTVLFALAGVSLSLAIPVFIGEAVDCCIGAGNVDFERLRNIVLILAGMVAASALFQ